MWVWLAVTLVVAVLFLWWLFREPRSRRRGSGSSGSDGWFVDDSPSDGGSIFDFDWGSFGDSDSDSDSGGDD